MVLAAGGKYDVTELGDNAFKDNAGLTGIDLSSTAVKTIGKYCFMNCTNLASVRFTDDTAIYLKLDTRAFANCTSLKKVQFASVQILKAAIPFINSGVEEITIMNPVQLGANAFSGMPSGLVLNCPNRIPTVSNIDAGMFGSTQNVTFLVPNADLKSKMETKFASNKKVTVKLANEGMENVGVLVKDGAGQIVAYTSLKEAFQGIGESSSDGPFAITVCQSSESVVWPADVE